MKGKYLKSLVWYTVSYVIPHSFHFSNRIHILLRERPSYGLMELHLISCGFIRTLGMDVCFFIQYKYTTHYLMIHPFFTVIVLSGLIFNSHCNAFNKETLTISIYASKRCSFYRNRSETTYHGSVNDYSKIMCGTGRKDVTGYSHSYRPFY